jgi:hypothetical protein
MAKISGNLNPRDDLTHELGPEPNYNESMYFNFFDRERSIGGFQRIGNRANEGYAETTTTLFLPGGRVLFNFKRAKIHDNDAFDAGGTKFEVVEATQILNTTYDGHACELAEPREMTNPREAFSHNPFRKVSIDLCHEAVGPMYGSSKNKAESARNAEDQFAKAHYEQHMRVRGTIEIEDEQFPIDGHGLRDHSWGPRHWQAIDSYEWLTLNFGDDLGAMVSIIPTEPGQARVHGVIVRGDELDVIEDASIEADYEDNGLFHTEVRASIVTEGGDEHEISGRVHNFIPLRNRRNGVTTHIGEGMTEWIWGDRTGYGLSEFLRQIR